MQWKPMWLGLALVAVTNMMAGCPGSKEGGSTAPNTPGPASGKFTGKDFKIGMIAKSSTNPVFLAAKRGAIDAAQKLSQDTGVNIEIDWRTPPNEDGQEQANRIAQAVNAGDNAILISCSDAAKVTGAINDAVAKGVAVMTFDSDAPDSKRFAFYGVDDATCGRQVIDELAKVAGPHPVVAILAGNQNAPNLRKRAAGAEEEAKKYPDMKVIGTFNHIETPQDATNEVMKDMRANPQINAWAMVGGWPLFASSLLKDLDPAKVKVVAVDALPAELPYVDKGIAPVLLAQPTYKWGYVSVQMIVDKVILGKDVQSKQMELVRVTKDTLVDWDRQLKDWGVADAGKYSSGK